MTTTTTTGRSTTITAACLVIICSAGAPARAERDDITGGTECRSNDRNDVRTRDRLLADVFMWVCEHPGVDDEDVARQFGLSPMDASDMVEELLNRGILNIGR